MAEATTKVRKKSGLAPILKGLKPAGPATAGAFALTFLFAAMMPMPWIQSICWQLYLDLIHPIFAPPQGNGARIGVALLFALAAATLALVAALALTKPAVKGNKAMNQRVAARARQAQGDTAETEEESPVLRRRRVDGHPDAPPVAPISATRDLPVGGLGPSPAPVTYGLSDSVDDDAPFDLDGAMLLGDADDMLELGAGDEAPAAPVIQPEPVDTSLGGMVARFEAGLDRRRNRVSGASDTPPAANEDDDPAVDLALEAALSTLQRMSRSAVG
jgi:hypothetical protein